jgi:4'-phosphopantetheinyl transferase
MNAVSHHRDAEQVHIWFSACEEEPATSQLDTLYLGLSLKQRYPPRKFRFGKDQCAYLLVHVLLPRALSQHHPVSELAGQSSRDKNGKPPIICARCGTLFLSLTHTAGLVACATSTLAEVGLDAEGIDRHCDVAEIARPSSCPAGLDTLEELTIHQKAERFFALWTLREPYGKAPGVRLPPPRRDVQTIPRALPHVSFPCSGSSCRFHLQLLRPTAFHIMACRAVAKRAQVLVAPRNSAASGTDISVPAIQLRSQAEALGYAQKNR